MRPSTEILGSVISAITNLREIKGSTSQEILHYISSVYDVPSTKARRQVRSALKRGVSYGILRKTNGYYSLPTDSEIARQEVAIQEIGLLDLHCQRKVNRSVNPGPRRKVDATRRRRVASGERRAARRGSRERGPCKGRGRGRGAGRKTSSERRGCRGFDRTRAYDDGKTKIVSSPRADNDGLIESDIAWKASAAVGIEHCDRLSIPSKRPDCIPLS